MTDSKARFRRMMDTRRKANVLYVDADKAKAQMDFYKSAIDAEKKDKYNTPCGDVVRTSEQT